MPISLSSCWCSQRHDDGYEMLREMVDLGFEYVELSHGIRLSLVPGILKAFEEGWVKASSIHNFCPLPPGVTRPAPNVFQPSGPSQVELSMWMRHSVNTLQFAQRIGAKRVVVHSGSCWFFWGDPTGKFREYEDSLDNKEHLGDDAQFVKLRDQAMRKMRRPVKKGMARLIESIKALVPAARDMGVILGLENREGFTELPMDAGWNAYLDAVGDVPEARYWHDAGHAQIKHQLGLLDHIPHLESLQDRLTAWHLHDVSKAGKDHQTIGTGVIDWDGIKKFFKPDQAFILELSPKLTKEQVLESNQVVEGLMKDQGIAL
ncbi:MAG: sugar phosphate isomerase/epimerase family protein [Opitutales bacterium]